MKLKKLVLPLLVIVFITVSCNNTKTPQPLKKESVALAISGMTCEIGCAKTIQAKLSKKEGVLDAKVVFTDSIATIDFDSNTTSKKELIAFVNGIAGGDLYKAIESK